MKDEELLRTMQRRDSSVALTIQESSAKKNPRKKYWTQSNKFNMSVGVVIVGNAVCLGVECDYGLANADSFLILEHLFCALFFVELLLHFGVEGPQIYFADRSNWLDFALVAMAVVDVWVIKSIGIEADLRIMSLLRLLRLARLARLVRLFRLFHELTLIVEGFVSGAKALTWAMVFLGLLVYIFAIFARLQIGTSFICESGKEVPEGSMCPATPETDGVEVE